MKHFGLILMVMRIVVILLFVANVAFMSCLYSSIKERYMEDLSQSLCRADQIEIVDRIVDAGMGGEDDVVWIQLGLQKFDTGDDDSGDELREKGYSQGYRRIDKQIVSEIARFLHHAYGGEAGVADTIELEAAFRRDLRFSGYNPEVVRIVAPGAQMPDGRGLWKLEHRVDGEPVYDAYITPLARHILAEMSGVIVTSVLIGVVLVFGFMYLTYVIRQQRTIEDMKDDFTNNMTHELKTPIAIAYAANDALLQFPDAADEARTRKYLTAATDQLLKLAGLVESILAMSMERRKNLAMAREDIRLRDFLEVIIGQQQLRSGKDCVFRLECPGEAAVNADPTHLSNVIGNLIDNSIKYSGDRVEIVVCADADGISVADNGMGIPEKALPEIFNKFYRVPTGNRTDVRGYGIGLFYVKSIVEKHGWAIAVKSTEGEGSIFTIKFKD